MFRASVSASERTDVAAEIAHLRRRAEAKGLTAASIEEMVRLVEEPLATFVERGRVLAASRSQMTVDKTINGTNFRVHVHFETGEGSGGFMASLKRLFGR